jgi:alanyl-tRNA synthetase
VAFTGEIGILKVLSVVNWKGGIRVSMLCGRRALEYVNREHDILTGLSRSLSTEAVNVQGIVDSYRDEIAGLKSELAGVKEKALIDEAGRMSPPYIIFGDDNLPAPVMKNVYNALTEMFDGFVGVFAGNDDEGYRYNAGSRDLDSRELAVKLKEALGAKGGGSFEMIQGKVTADKEAITRFFLEL